MPPEHEHQVPDGAARSGLRVLVVDDETTLRSVIGQVLRLSGHEVTTAASAEEALEHFGAAPYPLVFTDIVMGGRTGLDLLREIRRRSPETLVVMMTSHGTLETATAALREGAYDFLLKPFDDLFMIDAVARRAMDRLQLEERNRLLTRQLQTYAEELERRNQELKESADRDGLTGLFNRRYFLHALEVETARSSRHGHPFALILLDVDHFKQFNDTHGHPAGDELLRRLSAVLQSAQREETVCARYGGEEFVLLLPETGREGVRAHAERLRRAVEALPLPGSETQPLGRITISLGVACFPEDGRDAATLVRIADEALYRAKGAGRNRVAA
jgi:diguanylate cyclase (GGDEF)-like protein